MFRRLFRALAALAALAGLAAPASAQMVVPGGEAAWQDYYKSPAYLMPGLYWVRKVMTGACIEPRAPFLPAQWRPISPFPEETHFHTDTCSEVLVAVRPTRYGYYEFSAIPSIGERRRIDLMPISGGLSCWTRARRVVAGYPRLDLVACGDPAEAHIKGWDQWFALVPQPEYQQRNPTVIKHPVFQVSNSQPGGCVEIDDAEFGTMDQVPMIKACADVSFAQQAFEFQYREPIWDQDTGVLAVSRAMGWVPSPDGMRQAVAVMGIDLPGGDYWSGQSANDGGRECAMKCVNDKQCRAFTWQGTLVQGQDLAQRQIAGVLNIGSAPGRCWLKGSVPGRVANQTTASGIVRP